MSRAAAKLVASQITLKPDCVLGLATGSTPIGTYKELVAAYENGDLDIITDYTSTGLDGTAGSKVITITYKGKTASFVVNVAMKCVEKIEIIRNPVKLTYIENEESEEQT